MAGLIKGLKFASQLTRRSPSLIYSSTRSHWNKDYKPAPFPKTEQEIAAAAKKYNLLPEEYKPYADDGLGYGDYPHLPDVSIETRDAYYPYDFPEHKRNFKEPLHADIDLIGEDRYGTGEPLIWPVRKMFVTFAAVMAGWITLYYVLEDYKLYRPVAARQYPADGQVHYTFETK